MCHLNNLAKRKYANGKVIRKVLDVEKDHGNEHLYLDTGSQYIWEDNNYELIGKAFYDKIILGDSIVKEKGQTEMMVYREDSSFVIDLSFPCKSK